MPEQYDFGLSFQRCLLAAAWEDAKWAKTNKAVIRPDFFTDEVLGGVAKAVGSFLEREGSLPDLPGVLEEVKDCVAPGRKWQEYADEARKVWKRRGTNPEYYRRQAASFARRQAVANAVAESSQYLELGELDKIERLVSDALKVGSSAGPSRYYDFFSPARAKERIRGYLQEVVGRAGAIPTGFGPLDRRTKGGLVPGEVGCILGLAGHGKSSTLVSIGGNSVMAGRRVLHVSLENSIEVTSEKYDTFLFGKSREKIQKLPKTFRKAIESLRTTSNLQIVYSPPDTVNLSELHSIVSGADPHPDLCIVDYGACLKASSKREDKRFELTDIWKGLKRVAGECGVPVWSAHQANRAGVQATLLGMEHSAEFFDIAGIVDVMGSINWDEERPSEAILYIFKNRLGKTGFKINCEVEWELSRIRPLSDEEKT